MHSNPHSHSCFRSLSLTASLPHMLEYRDRESSYIPACDKGSTQWQSKERLSVSSEPFSRITGQQIRHVPVFKLLSHCQKFFYFKKEVMLYSTDNMNNSNEKKRLQRLKKNAFHNTLENYSQLIQGWGCLIKIRFIKLKYISCLQKYSRNLLAHIQQKEWESPETAGQIPVI